jgi:hypothetical protein
MVDRDDLAAFVTAHFAAMNRLAIGLGETEKEIGDRSHAISKFFFPTNEISDGNTD